MDAALSARLFAAIRPPFPIEKHPDFTNATWGAIVAAAIALREADLHLDATSGPLEWADASFLDALDSTFRGRESFEWRANKAFLHWSAGFFRNDAQIRIGIALERIVASWLAEYQTPPQRDRRNVAARMATLLDELKAKYGQSPNPQNGIVNGLDRVHAAYTERIYNNQAEITAELHRLETEMASNFKTISGVTDAFVQRFTSFRTKEV